MRSLLAFIYALLLFQSCTNEEIQDSKSTSSDNITNKDTATTSSVDSTENISVINYMIKDLHRLNSLFIDTLILGNFDTDKILDTATLWVPLEEFKMYGCKRCITQITFSNDLESMIFLGDIGGPIENVGDLNADGVDEIAYQRAWFMGCWKTYEVYQAVQGKWKSPGGMEYYACNDTIGFKARVQPLGKGKVRLEGENIEAEVTSKNIVLEKVN